MRVFLPSRVVIADEFSYSLFFITHFYFLLGAPEYVKVGCFKDKLRLRALPKLLASYRGTLDWNTDLSYIVRKCAQEAKKNNHMYFR